LHMWGKIQGCAISRAPFCTAATFLGLVTDDRQSSCEWLATATKINGMWLSPADLRFYKTLLHTTY
jgi:hypothetical protein